MWVIGCIASFVETICLHCSVYFFTQNTSKFTSCLWEHPYDNVIITVKLTCWSCIPFKILNIGS